MCWPTNHIRPTSDTQPRTCQAQIEGMPETRAFYERIGAETMSGGAEEMRKFQAEEIELWRRIAVKAKVQQE